MGEYNAYDRLKAKRKENSSSYNALENHKRNKANIVAIDIYESIDALNAAGSKEYDTYKSRFFDENGEYVHNYRGDAADAYNAYSQFKTKYDTESKKILNLLDEYCDALDADTTAKIRDYFSGASKSYEDMLNAYKSDTDYWSKWETEDDYNAAVKATEEYEGMKAADTNALSAEIETMKKVVPNAKKIKEKLDSFGDLNDTQKAALGGERWYEQQSKYLNDILTKYGYSSVDELESGLTEKEVYYNNATRIQKGIEMSSVSDPNADNYDPDFDTKAKAGEEKGLETHKALFGTDGHVDTWGKDVNDYIIAFRNKRNEEGVPLHVFNGAVSGGGGLTREERFAWYMTDEEYETYCYYKSFGDEKADEYLDSIEEGVNQRDAARIVDAVGDSTTIKLVFAAAAGGDQFSSGIKNLFDDRSYIPSSPVQIASGEIRESLDDTGPDILGSSLGQIGYDVINTGANMLPSILVSTAVGYINPVAGAVVGNTLMGASAAGNARQQMLNLGYNEDNANAYALLVGSSEALMQYALGGISKLGGVAASKIGLKLLSSVDNAFARFAIKFGTSLFSEGFEEGLQEVLTPFFENIALNANNDWSDIDWQEAAYSGLLGALSAGLLEGGSIASAEVNTYKEGKAVKDAGQTSNLVKLGKSFSADTVAFRLAGKVNENTGAYTIGRLLHEAGADSLSDTNMADIVKSLTRKGISPSHAQTIAKWMNKAVEGGNLTRLQAKALESNEYIAAAFRDVIVNPNSTVNQRIQGRNSILQEVAQYRTNVEAGKVAKTTDKADEKTGNVAENSDTKTSQPFVPYSNEEMAKRTAEGAYVVDSNGEKIVVADNHFDVSADGKTINTKTGETVEVKEIASIKDGKMNLRLENGDVVSIEDVSFPSKDEGIIYSAVMDMGINTEGANSLVKAFDSSKQSAARYALGIKEAYKYGRYNYSDDSMFKKGFSADLTEEQRRIAYEHGRIDEKARVAKKQAEIDAKEKTVTKKEGVKGAVHFDGDKMKLGKTRRVSLEVMEDLAHRLGINFYVYESFKKDGKYYYKDADGKVKPAPNGKYDPNTGAIYIDLNAGVDGKGTMLYTVAHELTHFIRDWSPAKFKVLADFLMEQYGKNNVSVDALVDKQIKKAEENNRTIDYDTAFEEVVADSMETMLTDGNLAKSLAAIKQKDKGLWSAIKRFFDKWAKAIKDAYAQYSPNSREGQIVAKWKDSIEQIQALFVEGLVDASESYAKAEGVRNSNKIVFGEESVDIGDTESGVKNQLREHEKIGENAAAYNSKHKNVDASVLTAGIEVMSEMAEAMIPFLDKDGILPPDLPGKTIFNNGSYGRTGENTTLCVRTLTYEDFKDRVSEKLGRPLTVAESLLVSQKIYDIAVEPQCIYCYVAADRKAYDGYLGEYWKSMDKYIKAMRDGGNSKELYTEYLNGRKDTAQQQKRWAMWESIAKSGKEYITSKDLATKRTRDAIVAKKNAFSDQVKDAQRYAQSASWAKTVFDYRAYKGDILKMNSKFVEMLNSEYGLRMYSFSDYTPAFIVENMQMLIDASVKGLKSLAYTKDTSYAEIFASTGQAINVSCFAKYDSVLGDYVEDNKQGANWENTKQLRKEHNNVGSVMVCTNDAMVEWALKQDWVDVVIPYHIVKTGTTIANEYGWNNYTSESADKTGGRVANIYPTEHNNDFATYSKLVEERGITPRFNRWYEKAKNGEISEQQYMKLVNEVRLPASELHPVVPTFDIDAAKKSFGINDDGSVIRGGFVDKGGYMGGWYRQGVDVNQEVMKVSADIEAGKSSLDVDYGMSKTNKAKVEEKYGVKHSDRDTAKLDADYMKAVEDGDMETVQRMVDEAAKRAGYTIEAYHGSRNEFTVFSSEKRGSSTNTETSKRWFFAADKTTANSYYPYGVIEALQGKDAAEKMKNKGKLYHMFLRMNNPLEADVKDYDYAAHRENRDAMMEYSEQADQNGNDGIILYHVLDNQLNTKARESTVYMFRDSSQAKSADPITYDDDGNVIPLSKRFNPANDDIRYSDRYWYPSMSQTEISYVRRIAKHEVNTTDNYIDSDTKWLYNAKNGNTFFALYSTADVDNPTVLYACKDARADLEHQFLIKYIDEEIDNNGSINLQSKIIDKILVSVEDAKGKRNVHSGNTVGRRGDAGNATVYSRNKRNRPSDAFIDCLRNIEKAQERNERDRVTVYSDRDYVAYDREAKLLEDTVDRYLAEYASKTQPRYAQAYIAYIDPSKFLSLTTGGVAERLNVERESRDFDYEGFKDATVYQPIFLSIDHETGRVIGHEGRHRMVALFNAGVYRVPVLLFDSSNKTSKETLRDFRLYGQFNKYAEETVGEAIPLNFANRDEVIEKFSKLSSLQRMGERLGLKETLRYQDRDPEVEKAYEDVNKQLTKENAKLKEDVASLKELLKIQKTVTHGKMFSKTSIEAVAGRIMRYANANGDVNELVSHLTDTYSYIISGEDVSWEGIAEKAQDAVDWLRSHEKHTRQRDEYADEVLKDLRSRRISLDDQQKQEAAHTYGSYNNFRQKMMGKVIIANDGIQLDSLWQELCDKYPAFFDSEVTSNDQPVMLMDIISDLQNSYVEDYYYEDEMVANDLLAKIYDEYWNVATLHTVADAKQREISLLKNKHKERMDKLREDHKSREKNLRQAQSEKLARTRQEYRDRSLKQQKEMADKYREQRQNAVDSRKKTELKRQIHRVVRDLNGLLNRGTKERNVKVEMRETVGSALKLADIIFNESISNEDIVLNGAETALPKEEELLGQYALLVEWRDNSNSSAEAEKYAKKIRELDKQLSDLFIRERARLNRTTVSAAINELASAYSKLKIADADYVNFAYDEELYKRLTALSGDLDGVIVRDMTRKQLEEVYKTFAAIRHTVREGNKYFRKGKSEDLAQMVSTVQNQILSHYRAPKNDPRPGAKIVSDVAKSFLWNEMKPLTAFEVLGSDAYTELFWDAINAESEWARFMEEAKTFLDEQKKNFGYKSWNMASVHEFVLPDGKKFKLTLQDMMSIYAYSKREQAYDHMTSGGFQFAEHSEYKDEKKRKRIHITSDLYATNLETISKIVGELEKMHDGKVVRYVDAVQEYLTSLGGKGNEVSRVLYGIDIFNEKAYFPLMSAKDYRSSVEEALNNTQTQISLKNTGMTKQTVPHARNPIILQGFDEVVAGHIKKMADYCTQVLPIENLRRVFDSASLADEGNSVSTKAIIKKVYGESAAKYFDKYITDLNGGAFMDDTKSPTMAMFSKFKATAVGASLSVVVQQPFAVVRAMDIISPHHFVLGKAGKSETKRLYDEIKRYAPTAIIKQMGGFDTGSSRTAKEYLGVSNEKGLKRVVNEVADKSTWLAGQADVFGWDIIWLAVKREVNASKKYKFGSKEFYEACGKRFTEVIVRTQVYDSVNSRSGYMRSKSDLVKFSTSFMGEPTTIVNEAYLSLLNFIRAEKGEKVKAAGKLGRTMGVLLVSTLLTTTAKTFVYAMRDDDDDEAFFEKWANSIGENLRTDLDPFSLLPWCRDVVSLVEGWDVERPDMTLIANVIASAKKLIDDGATTEEVLAFIGDAANIFGVPAKNLIRDGNGIVNFFNDIFDDVVPTDIGGAFVAGLSGAEYTKKTRAENASNRGDTAEVKRVVNEMIEEKQDAGKTEKEAKSAVRSSFTSMFKADYVSAMKRGDVGEGNRIRKLLYATGLYGTLSELDATLKKWRTEE